MLVFFVAHAQRFWGLRMTHLHSSPTNLHYQFALCESEVCATRRRQGCFLLVHFPTSNIIPTNLLDY